MTSDGDMKQACEELHAQITTLIAIFLRAEFSRREGKACAQIDLVHAPQGQQPDPIRSWDRKDVLGLFGDPSSIDALSAEISRVAVEHAETFEPGSGYHRYELKSIQVLGGRSKMGFRVRVPERVNDEGDDRVGKEGDQTEELPGPLHLSLHCDGIDVEIHMTAAKRQRTGSLLDKLADSALQFMPQIASRLASVAPVAPTDPQSIVDFARARLAAGELSIEDMASVSTILCEEHERRARRAARAKSPARTIADLVEDHLDNVGDRDLGELIDLMLAAERRARGEPSEATS